MPELSIGIPVYNGEQYLAETLDSLLAQSFTDFEIVIADNASTDGTALCEHVDAGLQKVRVVEIVIGSALEQGRRGQFERPVEVRRGAQVPALRK